MVNPKKLVFFSLIFFIGFTIIGDTYIYFLDGKIAESDFKYTTGIKDEDLNQEYLHDLKKLSIAEEMSQLCGVLSHRLRRIEPVSAGEKAIGIMVSYPMANGLDLI